jgi:putative transposase
MRAATGVQAAWYGRTLIKIAQWYPSSKTCSVCAHVLESLELDVREWTCPNCSTHHDRDLNAASSILAAGLAVSACGGDVRPNLDGIREGCLRGSRNPHS